MGVTKGFNAQYSLTNMIEKQRKIWIREDHVLLFSQILSF